MKILGVPVPFTGQKALSPITQNRGWFSVLEPFTGAWQRNIKIDRNLVLSNPTIFACMTLIASDIAKLRVKLVEKDTANQIWREVTSPAFSPVLRKPNKFQNHIQFWENWILSKLSRGNTYALKKRDDRGVVIELYILDPDRVTPMVTEDGDVYYDLTVDNIAGLQEGVMVPASEIIHDRFNCLFHPLVGLTPIFAAALAATQGLNIQEQSTKLFGNNSRPGGILTAPGNVSPEAQARLKEQWEIAFSGKNSGRVAVLTDGLTYQNLGITAVDAQLIDQLKWTDITICSTFHVPPYKVGIGEPPKYNNIQALNIDYYSQCLQRLIEDAEACLDEGLGLGPVSNGRTLGTEFDQDNLLRMDSKTQMEVLEIAVGAGIMAPNEARRRVDLPGVEGGESPYLQQQNYSLAALARRDAQADPFATGTAATDPVTLSVAPEMIRAVLQRFPEKHQQQLDVPALPSPEAVKPEDVGVFARAYLREALAKPV